MGWEDRQYYRDRGGDVRSPLWLLLNGSVPLFTAFGIRVRAHSSLIVCIALTILLGGLGKTTVFGESYTLQLRIESMTALFIIILLHEYGHCFASRWVGGDPEQIMMTPLGGLAFANAPHRPGGSLITTAGGPAVNLLICIVAGLLIFAASGYAPWHPGQFWLHYYDHNPSAVSVQFFGWVFWVYLTSLILLIFNLLPIFPLDGGQMLGEVLWFKLGYVRAMNIACYFGIVGGAILAVSGFFFGGLLLILIGLSCVFSSIAFRRYLREIGPEFDYGLEPADYSASLRPDEPPKRKRRKNTRAMRRLKREAEIELAERQLIDVILAKVSAKGMNSLTRHERRALRRATERQRKLELESPASPQRR